MNVRFKERLLLPAAILVIGAGGCARVERSSGPLPQQIYVWQRVWNQQVEAALTQARDSAAGFAVLVAEIDVRAREPKIDWPDVNYVALQASARPIALAIRIDPFAGPFESRGTRTESIVRLARDSVERAREHGIDPVELQIDFDCGDAKLDGYRRWLQEIRAAVAPLPVTPTMLPSWLKRREFAALARESGSFILQVHSVAIPQNLAELGPLTDPARAIAWVEQAAKIGVPFRVSLPTYSYLVAFDKAGKFRALSAEGPSARWPAEARLVRWEAQPAEMAQLVARWNRERPATLRGLCWYRLPVASDNLNWSWKTLAAAMEGRAPQRALRVSTSSSQPSEIIVRNEGEMDEPLPRTIGVRWNKGRLIAADALDGYTLTQMKTGNGVAFQLDDAGAVLRLRPGARRSVGWIRFESEAPLQLSVSADSSQSLGAAAVVAGDRF